MAPTANSMQRCHSHAAARQPVSQPPARPHTAVCFHALPHTTAGEARPPLTVVLVNNSGGGIFSFLPIADALPEDVFTPLWATPQHVDLEGGWGSLATSEGGASLRCMPVCRGQLPPVHLSVSALPGLSPALVHCLSWLPHFGASAEALA